MTIQSYFFNAMKDTHGEYDRVYDANDVTSYLDKIVGNGVFPNPSTNLQVKPASGMNIVVKAGQGWINGYKLINTADLPLTIEAADVLLGRIDAVIFYVDMNTREMGITVKQGTKAASPVAPTMARTTSRWEMCLAQVTVAKQATSITAANIRDTRGNSDLCGIVQGLIQQIDTTELWEQQQDEYAQAVQQFENEQEAWQESSRQDFDDWFDQVKDTLASATLLQKLEQVFTTSANVTSVDVTEYIPSFKYSIDVLEVYIDGLRLDANEYTQHQNTVTFATPITHAGTEVALVVYKSIDGSDAETIVTQVQEMQAIVDQIEQGMYIATGENDNVKLSQAVKDFLNGGDDYRQLEIQIYGDMAVTAPASSGVWFDFDVQNTTRRVILDFSQCKRMIIDASNSNVAQQTFIKASETLTVRGLQMVVNNAGARGAAQLIASPGGLFEECAFWMTGASNGTGQLTGATAGTFTNCRFAITAQADVKTYGFSADGNILRLDNCEVIAYNPGGSSNESVAVQVQGAKPENVLVMNSCNCPIRARSGYKQDNVVKINSGLYCLTGNMLGMAAAKYTTGDGKTEIGTMIVSK